ncbi:Acyl-(Acyl-carrier-protein)--UDP-N-acety lglucosamine O-acyltransferase LpxA [Neorhizobium galegae bv. officinalis bv. officinalis str. HAMBI 1141]|uniref:Acyl-[acyl-carrier-protein]--UDP-N-acetylglucosamine O-acyltransferase n=1 Tax=Neorhizobium galegae bv. officinalis bv. officinalis str. HAMBI 1141 TaxID=1028801 RepID=A0A068T787_NEOGA|nr:MULTISPECIES: acyl-ACP--UDP-N-acetylglucosamine O-acyltransferase [Neorhizobium]MCJ9670134.1 acyl-ACP--UDP-N-acetylglucosamine O-acyltransferase [Neorhizobium sp. SHOUNA12B]MCJ9744565.1 acyl-ACP--UDP-N-acetylglucosamine O-acyltransferase [Neorhizobium sp. SHOUNA12A]CDN53886.1 Acyl-(Acyl-carrier-protein)--UDP-N-acety lglucosamine O-acyltransferase LpxA [Neorhizobium galegae bv. officinalis bv. officinalis str. HAMBI 1141]
MKSIAASARIHPLALVEDGAVIGENVVVGPFSHVGPRVVLKDGVELVSHAVVSGRTEIGRNCRIFPMAIIGGVSQSLHEAGEDSTLTVGDNCTMREGVTMNCGTVGGGGKTVVGNNCLFLANSHVAHDCQLGNDIIMSNNVMLAGHVHVADRAILGGGCAVHQFTRIGRQAFIGGLTAVNYDVIPYGMLNGNPGVLGGLNVVGMTRAGIERATIHVVRRAFKQIFEGESNIRANAAAIRNDYADCKEAMEILDFIAADSDRAISSTFRGKG